MVNKKAQMKIQQMAFMLMVITFFFILVGLFILSTKFSGLKKSAEDLEEKNAMLLVSKLAASPEFACGEVYSGQKVNCIDSDKVVALMKKQQDYSEFWGVKTIEIRKIYPESETKCTPTTYPNCGIFKILQDSNSAGDKSLFVSLCRKENSNSLFYDKCELAKLIVGF